MHSHHHTHGDTDAGKNARRLRFALFLTLGFAAVEAATGWWANSLALMGDAGHMLTDSSALALAAMAALLARRPATRNHSYGMGRVEVLAALANGLFMLLVVAAIVYGALLRFQTPVEVNGPVVMVVAAIGLLLNIALFKLLSHDHADMNTRGALLHVMGDLLGSVAALASGLVIWWTGWSLIDPILSVLICMLILGASTRLIMQALRVVMEGVPPHLELQDIGMAMARTAGVQSVHDLHVWNLSSREIALSAHVMLRDINDWPALLASMQTMLSEQYGITHTTLQPELPPTVRVAVPRPGETRETGVQ